MSPELTNIIQSLAQPLTSLIIVIGLLMIALRSLAIAHDLTKTLPSTIIAAFQAALQAAGLTTKPQSAPVEIPTPQIELKKVTPPCPPVPTPSPSAPAPAPAPHPAPAPAPAPKPSPDRFAECMAFVWPEEGGFSNDPQDHGGATNLGVTLPDLERAGLPATIEELKSLTKDKAASLIYRPFYWNAMHCDELPAGVDLEVFDLGINAGIHEAAKLLERDVGTKEDGVIGPLTIAAAHAKPALDIINTFNTERVTFYKSLKQFDRFGRDWLRRSADCFALAVKMAKS